MTTDPNCANCGHRSSVHYRNHNEILRFAACAWCQCQMFVTASPPQPPDRVETEPSRGRCGAWVQEGKFQYVCKRRPGHEGDHQHKPAFGHSESCELVVYGSFECRCSVRDLPTTMHEPTSFDDSDDMPAPTRGPASEDCTCTPPPSCEGPCAWCDVHGQPSAAWEQGLREGEHAAKVVHAMEIRDLSTALRAMARRAVQWKLNTAKQGEAAYRLAAANADLRSDQVSYEKDQEALTRALHAARADLARLTARLAAVEAENVELAGRLEKAQHVPHENCCPLGRDGDPDIRHYHSCDTREMRRVVDPAGPSGPEGETGSGGR